MGERPEAGLPPRPKNRTMSPPPLSYIATISAGQLSGMIFAYTVTIRNNLAHYTLDC